MTPIPRLTSLVTSSAVKRTSGRRHTPRCGLPPRRPSGKPQSGTHDSRSRSGWDARDRRGTDRAGRQARVEPSTGAHLPWQALHGLLGPAPPERARGGRRRRRGWHRAKGRSIATRHRVAAARPPSRWDRREPTSGQGRHSCRSVHRSAAGTVAETFTTSTSPGSRISASSRK